METAHFRDIGPTDGQCVLCAAQRTREELKALPALKMNQIKIEFSYMGRAKPWMNASREFSTEPFHRSHDQCHLHPLSVLLRSDWSLFRCSD